MSSKRLFAMCVGVFACVCFLFGLLFSAPTVIPENTPALVSEEDSTPLPTGEPQPVSSDTPAPSISTPEDIPEPPSVLEQEFVRGTGNAVRADVSYGSDPLQEMEVYYRKDQENAPIILIVHGGSEDTGDKSRMRDFAKTFSEEGYTVVLPNYRYGESIEKLPSRDVMCAAATIVSRADEYTSNGQKLVIIGFSYGGYVSSLSVFNQNIDWLEGCAVQSLPKVSGFIGVASNYGSPNTSELWELFGIESLEEVKERYNDIRDARDGAINYVDANDPPTFLVHGTKDPKFNELRAQDFEQVLRAAGVPVTLTIVPNGTHTANLVTEKGTIPDLKAFIDRVF